MNWQEFSFSLNGQSHHVYSREEADALVADGKLKPDTAVTLFLEGGKRRRTTADTLGLAFASAPAAVPTPTPAKASPPVELSESSQKAALVALPTKNVGVNPPQPSQPAAKPAEPAPSDKPPVKPATPPPASRPAPVPPPPPPPATGLIFFGLLVLALVAIFLWTRSPPDGEPAAADNIEAPAAESAMPPMPAQTPPVAEAATPEAAPVEEPEPSVADVPPACREWRNAARVGLCIAVQGRYRRLQRVWANSVGNGDRPEVTLRNAVDACSTRRCAERRIDARIAEITSPPDVIIPPPIAPGTILSPSTMDRSRALRPRGRESDWVTTDDYPSSAVREGAEGTTATRLQVGIDGRVTACEVTSSSGNAALDEAACRSLRRRARFEPALDRDGNPVEAYFTKRIRWRLPEE